MAISKKVIGVVANVTKYGNNIFKVNFKIPIFASKFKAGQFLHLTLEDFDPSEAYWPESRVFSIASKPGNPLLEVVYGVKGQYTKKMSETLREGMKVWLKLPFGDFIVDKHIRDGQTVVFIAGGTGISPFIPFFYLYLDNGHISPLHLYYGIRNKDTFLYKEVIDRISKIANVHIVEGLFDIEKISLEILKINDAVCFISGPQPMIAAFQKTLEEKGFPTDSIIIDNWE